MRYRYRDAWMTIPCSSGRICFSLTLVTLTLILGACHLNQVTFEEGEYLISKSRNLQAFNVVVLLRISKYVVVLCLSFAQRSH